MNDEDVTVKVLRDWLLLFPDETLVIMSRDSEGNGFSPLAAIELGKYVADSTYSGDFYQNSIIGNEEYNQPEESAIEAICLWPTN